MKLYSLMAAVVTAGGAFLAAPAETRADPPRVGIRVGDFRFSIGGGGRGGYSGGGYYPDGGGRGGYSGGGYYPGADYPRSGYSTYSSYPRGYDDYDPYPSTAPYCGPHTLPRVDYRPSYSYPRHHHHHHHSHQDHRPPYHHHR